MGATSVRADRKLDRPHRVIQIAKGWTDSHTHQFLLGSVCYTLPDRESDALGGNTLNERKFTVANLTPVAKRKFTYEYDLGDGWEHEVLVEKVLPADPAFKHAISLAGANQYPRDDCGGIPGYYQLLEILPDPKHEEHDAMKEMKECLGGDWNHWNLATFGLACISHHKARMGSHDRFVGVKTSVARLF